MLTDGNLTDKKYMHAYKQIKQKYSCTNYTKVD